MSDNDSSEVVRQLHLLDRRQEIRELTADFIGRAWLFQEIAEWLKPNGQQFFLITSDAGVGKSAIAARLTLPPYSCTAYYFVRDPITAPRTVLQWLALQLSSKLPWYADAVRRAA